MKNNTRIYNRFSYWSVADCDCVHCLNYAGKDQPCSLDVCCIADIREEALRREQTAADDLPKRDEATLCPV